MIVPVMVISNLLLTQQFYSEETNGAHARNRDRVLLNSGAHSFRFLGSQKLPCFLTFPYPVPVPKNWVIFTGCNFKSRASQVGLHKQKKKILRQ